MRLIIYQVTYMYFILYIYPNENLSTILINIFLIQARLINYYVYRNIADNGQISSILTNQLLNVSNDLMYSSLLLYNV